MRSCGGLQTVPRLPEAWRTAMGSPENRVLVSATSIWEIAIKAGSRRLQLDLPPRLELDALAQACGFEDLPIRAAHAAAVRSLPPHHADPFDRILVAQATVERLILISADRAIQFL